MKCKSVNDYDITKAFLTGTPIREYIRDNTNITYYTFCKKWKKTFKSIRINEARKIFLLDTLERQKIA